MGTMALDDGVDPISRLCRERHLGPQWHMESMWRDLPANVLEKVITFLPLASLLRFKTVSKEWNRLISHPNFAPLHAQASAPEEYVLVAARFDSYESNPIQGWDVLDVANKKFFTLRNDFLTEYVKQEGLVPRTLPYNSWHQRAVLAADGGLFCVSYSFDEQSSVLLVCNPVLKIVKRLPHLTGWSERAHRVVMSTDRISREYEVFIVNDPHHQYEPKTISIYSSKTGRWKSVPNVPPPSKAWNYYAKTWCSVSSFVKNEFFEPYGMHHPETAGVISFNKVTGVLSDPGVVLPSPLGEATNLYLVASKGRLFCVARWESQSQCYPYIDILEIILAKKEYKVLARMSEELVRLVLGDIRLHDPFTAVGCADSILICSVTGRSVAYSLSNKSWHHYPQNGLRQALDKFGEDHQEVFASNYCISLCAPSNF